MVRLLNKFLVSVFVVVGLSGVFGVLVMVVIMIKVIVNGQDLIYGINEDGDIDYEIDFSVLDVLNIDGVNVELFGICDYNKVVDMNNVIILIIEFDDDLILVFSSLINDIWEGLVFKEGYDNFVE